VRESLVNKREGNKQPNSKQWDEKRMSQEEGIKDGKKKITAKATLTLYGHWIN